ncbi:MAG TPA: class I SAM-dependent methyltransferase [Caulobacteraceae bacterium]
MDGLRSENLDGATVRDFGREWLRFDQSGISPEELAVRFAEYFSIFPWEDLPANAVGLDAGCGSGRWAIAVAPRVGRLHCIDASEEALGVARRRLEGMANVVFHAASIEVMPISDETMDFGYSLGVLHHLPDPEAGLAACVSKLKRGAPMLVYIYYAFDNRPRWFHILWHASDVLRRLISRMPFPAKSLLADIISALIYWPLAKAAYRFEAWGAKVDAWPLSYYRTKSYYTMRTDSLDRFGTRLEHRMTRPQIETMMANAGLGDIRFSEASPFWCAVGRKL